MTLLLDVDGVLADFCSAVDREVQELGEPLPTWGSWELDDNVPAHVRDRVYDRLRSHGWAQGIAEFPGAVEAVRGALADGLDLAFVTHRLRGSPTWAYDREVWLEARFGPKITVISTGSKFRVRGEALVEDASHNLAQWPTTGRYLIDRPYNRQALPFHTHRCAHVADAISHYRAAQTVGVHVLRPVPA